MERWSTVTTLEETFFKFVIPPQLYYSDRAVINQNNVVLTAEPRKKETVVAPYLDKFWKGLWINFIWLVLAPKLVADRSVASKLLDRIVLGYPLDFWFHALVQDRRLVRGHLLLNACVFIQKKTGQWRQTKDKVNGPQRRDNTLLGLIPKFNQDSSGGYFQDWRLGNIFKLKGIKTSEEKMAETESNIREEAKPGIRKNLPATDAQSLERSTRECLKCGIKGFQPLQMCMGNYELSITQLLYPIESFKLEKTFKIIKSDLYQELTKMKAAQRGVQEFLLPEKTQEEHKKTMTGITRTKDTGIPLPGIVKGGTKTMEKGDGSPENQVITSH
ncbi:hypothetical protein DUI87_07615 [Hirundo rustica rustica]|uniref:Uncharacterized protein n=1 Tax=Hirundo rustica rustica TaxID=333673 RepID=A0A3M0KVH8_HIRRU|nr:hypothetical protein DUI87_07615 [Hirundo rustica rustica]